MLKKTSDWGGARSNGTVRFRRGGKFVKKPTLDCEVCPNCRALIFPEVHPIYNSFGMPYPHSLQPVLPQCCHRCDFELGGNLDDFQTDNFIMALCELGGL